MENQLTKEDKPSKLDKTIKISIMAGSLIIALSITYYLVIFLPQKEKVKIEQQRQEEEIRKECNKQAVEKRKKAKSGNEAILIYDAIFNSCLNEKGL